MSTEPVPTPVVEPVETPTPVVEPVETPTTFARRPNAVGSPPQHYGNPLGEQRALAAGSAIVDLSDRAVITVTGPDRLTWLDSLTSQSLAGLAAGARGARGGWPGGGGGGPRGWGGGARGGGVSTGSTTGVRVSTGSTTGAGTGSVDTSEPARRVGLQLLA